MAWALVNTIEMQFKNHFDEIINDIPKKVFKEITAEVGTIINLIVYDGIAPYIAEEGFKLIEVPDTAKLGDTGYK